MPVIVPIRVRQDTIANWESVNPVLSLAEPGLDTTNNILKFGDGSSNWNTLPNFNTPRASTITVAPSDCKHKNQADYMCDGTADDVQIQAAINSAWSSGGGLIKLLEGTFNLSAGFLFNSSNAKNIIIEGSGKNTILLAGFSGRVFDLQDQSLRLVIRDLTIHCNNVATHGVYADLSTQVGNRDILLEYVSIRLATEADVEFIGSNVDGLQMDHCFLSTSENGKGIVLNQSSPYNVIRNTQIYVNKNGIGVQSLAGSGYFHNCMWSAVTSGMTMNAFIDASTSPTESGATGATLSFDRCHFEPGTFTDTPIRFGNYSVGYKWENIKIDNCWIGCAKDYSIDFNYVGNINGTETNRNQSTVSGCIFKDTATANTAYIHLSATAYNVSILQNCYESTSIPIYAGSPVRALVYNPVPTGALLRYVNGSVTSPLVAWYGVPSASSSSGQAGQIAYDTNYLYVCVATNAWKRVSLSGW